MGSRTSGILPTSTQQAVRLDLDCWEDSPPCSARPSHPYQVPWHAYLLVKYVRSIGSSLTFLLPRDTEKEMRLCGDVWRRRPLSAECRDYPAQHLPRRSVSPEDLSIINAVLSRSLGFRLSASPDWTTPIPCRLPHARYHVGRYCRDGRHLSAQPCGDLHGPAGISAGYLWRRFVDLSEPPL